VRRIALIACLGAPLAAHADNWTIHATASGDVATTDNTFSVDEGRQGDIFFQVRPGMLFTYNAPRNIHELNAEVELLQYVSHSERPSVTVRTGWRGMFLPGPRSELTVNANYGTGQLSTLTSNLPPDQSGLPLLPAGKSDFHQADGATYFSWQATKEVRVTHNAFGRYTFTDDNVEPPNGPTRITTSEVGMAIGVERDFRRDSFSLSGGGSYVYLRRRAPMGIMMGPRIDKQLNPRATLAWRHDFDRHWSGALDIGAVYVNPVGIDPYHPLEERRGAPFPTYGGLLAYTQPWGRATLNVRRQVTPSQFIPQNTLNDTAVVQAAMPLEFLDRDTSLRRPRVVGLASVGVERTQLIDATTSDLQSAFYLGRIDAAVQWSPRPGQTYGIRYEFAYQHGDDSADMLTASFFRNTIYFTFALRYPDRVAVKVPRRGQSVRADRRDLSPVGAEPVIPDPTEVLPEGEEGEGEGGDGD
jgi:hypothetical protein